MKKQITKRRYASLSAMIVLLLSVTLSLSSCAGGLSFLLDQMVDRPEESTTEAKINDGTATGSGEDASSLIERAESDPSIYGSAGSEVFAISDVVRMVQDSVVEIYTDAGSGSGVIISDKGYILTCNHVVEDATTVVVSLRSGNEYNAQLIGADAATDLAVVKITPDEGDALVAAKHGVSDDLVVGETVVAIGNPLGTLGGTVTHGIISSTARQVQFSNSDGSTTSMTLLQTDAAINSGNSGGGLFNLQGELIGIVNAKYASTGVEGLGFAIPIDSAYEVELDLIQYGYVRGIVDDGLALLTVNSSNYRYYYYYYGIQDLGIYVESSEFCTDLVNRDRITAVNGIAVSTVEEYENAIKDCKIGDVITVSYVRYSFRGRSITGSTNGSASITLREYVPDTAKVDFQ